MKEQLRTSIIRSYSNLCRRLKINNWRNYIFMENSIEIMDKLERRISELEKELNILKRR